MTSEDNKPRPLTILVILISAIVVTIFLSWLCEELLIIPFIVITGVALFMFIYRKNINKFKDVFEILAITIAAIWFFYQLLGGMETSRLELDLSLLRARDKISKQTDQIIVNIGLKGGDNAELKLHQIQIRLSNPINDSLVAPLINVKGLNKIIVNEENNSISSWSSDKDKFYRLSLNEKISFSELATKLDTLIPIKVEVVVLAERSAITSGPAQFRASAISFPN